MPTKPMLDGIELDQVQKVEAEDEEVLGQHGVPALEGDFLQDLGRRVTRLTLTGVITGATSDDQLKTLREKFRAATPVPFVDDIAVATKVEKVLIEEFGVRELAGRPNRFEFEMTLREFLPPPKPKQEEPPPPPPPPPKPVPEVETGTLEVEVIVEGQTDFDFSKVTVTVDGTKNDGSTLSKTLVNRVENVWTEERMPLGSFDCKAVVKDPGMSGSAAATVRANQTTRVQIVLRPGALIAKAFVVHFRFDKAFVEPCMAEVLAQVTQHAANHADEKVLIVGHTDKTGSNEYNQSLSERRARSVYAYLTFGRDAAAAAASEAEWNLLRKPATGGLPQIKDSWGTREYQHMLQDLDFYSGNIDGDHGPITNEAVKSYRQSKGLPNGTNVDDAVWEALIHDYLAARSLAISEKQFHANASDGCDGGILKWLGCGEESPLPLPQPPTENPHRQYRRVELLFIASEPLPCKVPEPVTFNLPAPGAVSSTWCLGPGDSGNRCCFGNRNCEDLAPDHWCIEPAETESVLVEGSMKNADGTPAGNIKYELIAPDGEFMDGEVISGARRGEGSFGVTRPDGTFSYPDKPKATGIFVMAVNGPFVARLADDPPGFGKGNIVCKRLAPNQTFDVILDPAETGDPTRKLRATTFDRFGEARDKKEVQVIFSDGSQGTAVTNTRGEFVLDMANPQEIAKIRFSTSDDPEEQQFAEFFIDVEAISTEEGVRRRLHNLGYLIDDDLPRAITSFQATHGLDTTGEIDDVTRSKLASVHDGKEPPRPEFAVNEQRVSPSEVFDSGPPL